MARAPYTRRRNKAEEKGDQEQTLPVVMTITVYASIEEAATHQPIGYFLVRCEDGAVLCSGNIYNERWTWTYAHKVEASWPRGLFDLRDFPTMLLPARPEGIPPIPPTPPGGTTGALGIYPAAS